MREKLFHTLHFKVPFMDLSKNSYTEYEDAIKKVFQHGKFILGEEVAQLEFRINRYCNVPYAVLVSSGTDALHLALRAHDIGFGDEVIIPNISFIATANAIMNVGAKVVFCDVGDDFNINPLKIRALITSKTKAIVVVHYAGKIGSIREIKAIAKAEKLLLIEDAAQAFGAMKDKKYAGTFGDIGCFSLNPMKPLGAFGEAGLVMMRNKKIYQKILMLRSNGVDWNKKSQIIGMNAKPDTLQAAILDVKLTKLEESLAKREAIAKIYSRELKDIVSIPQEPKNGRCAYFTYTIIVQKRDALLKHLLENGIEAKVYHTAMSKEKPYRSLHHKELKNSVYLSRHKLALPCNDTLSDADIAYVITKIKEFFC